MSSYDQSSFLNSAVLLLVLCSILRIAINLNRHKLRRLPLPPGPRGLPLIGNYLDIPTVNPWLTYQKWADEHGDIVFMQLPFQPTIVVGSVNAAIDLMEKRSNIYSDRLMTTMDELSGWDWVITFLSYGPEWRSRRRSFHQYFNQGAVARYQPIQTREVKAFIRRLQTDNFSVKSVMQTAAAIIMGVAYGIKVSGMDNEYVQITHMAMSSLTLTKRPGIFWVDYFPFLRHVPAWVPGATGRKLSNFAKPLVYAMRDRPYAAVKSDYLNGTAEPSIARMMMEALDAGYSDNMDLYSEQEQIKKDALGVAYAGGFETSSSATLVFFLAMAMYPDVQKKAQAELDRVIGEGRLPSFEDYQSLPYIQAVILEILRWMPVVPMGVVHRVMVEDEYKGYRIPKGALMIPNAWAMAHDPKDYPCPEQFNPERFITDGTLDTNVRDPSTIAFGFGRRVCPGRHLAKDTLFLTIASTLYVYDIEAALDEERKPYPLRAEQTTAFLSAPKSVPCIVKPRSASAEQLINNLS